MLVRTGITQLDDGAFAILFLDLRNDVAECGGGVFRGIFFGGHAGIS